MIKMQEKDKKDKKQEKNERMRNLFDSMMFVNVEFKTKGHK